MADQNVLSSYTPGEWSRARTEASGTTAISETVTAKGDGFVQNFSWNLPSGCTVTLTYYPQGDSNHPNVIVSAATATSGNDAAGWPVKSGDTFTVAITGAASGYRSYTFDFGGRLHA